MAVNIATASEVGDTQDLRQRRRSFRRFPRMKSSLVAVQVAVLGTLLAGCPADIGAIVGDTLSQAQAAVDQVIAEATSQADTLLLNLTAQVQTTLDSTKSALEDVMNMGYKQVNSSVQSTLDQVNAIVGDLNNKATLQLHDVAKLSQQLANTLPFSNKNPQVTSYTPVYYSVVQADGTVPVTVSGNFQYAFEQKMTPTMTWDGLATPLNAGTLITQSMTFYVPAALLQANAQTIRRVQLTLNIPYQSGTLFKSIEPGVFRLTVSVLPRSPVKGLVLHNVFQKTENPPPPPLQRKTFTQPEGTPWHVFSYDCQKKDVTEGPFMPDVKWAIDTSSVHVNTSYPRGSQNQNVGLINAPGGITVRIQTFPNCFLGVSNGSGDVYVSVKYTETYQPPTPPPVTTDTPVTVDLLSTLGALGWGGSYEVGVTPGKWSLDAVLFDGTTRTYSATDTANPYLGVIYQQGSQTVKISGAPTQELVVTP